MAALLARSDAAEAKRKKLIVSAESESDKNKMIAKVGNTEYEAELDWSQYLHGKVQAFRISAFGHT